MAVVTFTLAGNERWMLCAGPKAMSEGGCWFWDVQSLLFEVMANEMKQSDQCSRCLLPIQRLLCADGKRIVGLNIMKPQSAGVVNLQNLGLYYLN